MTNQTNSEQSAAVAQTEPKKFPRWQVLNGRHLTIRSAPTKPTGTSKSTKPAGSKSPKPTPPKLAGRGATFIVESGAAIICSGVTAIAYPGTKIQARSGSTVIAYEGVEIVKAHKNAAVIQISQAL